MDNVYTPTNARKNLYSLLKKVNDSHVPIMIASTKNEDAVLISKSDWDAIKETMYLENAGVGKVVREREKDNSGFTDIDNIDWNKL